MRTSTNIGLLLLRAFLGGYLLWAGIGKIQDPQWPDAMRKSLEKWDEAHKDEAGSPRIYQRPEIYDKLREFSWSQRENLAEAVRWGEAIGGACILIGLLSPLALVGQILLNASILLLAGHASPAVECSNLAFIVIGLALFLARPGRIFGLDTLLHRRGRHRWWGWFVA